MYYLSTDCEKLLLKTIAIALDEMHSSAVLSLLVFFFAKSQLVGAGASVERDQSAPAQTAPRQAGFGSD